MENKYADYIFNLEGRGYINYTSCFLGKDTEYGTSYQMGEAKRFSYPQACRIRKDLLKKGVRFEMITILDGIRVVETTKYPIEKKEKVVKKERKEEPQVQRMKIVKKIKYLTIKDMKSVCLQNKGKECCNCELCFKKDYPYTHLCVFTRGLDNLETTFSNDKEFKEFLEREVEILW